MSIADYSATPSGNTSVGGINIAEGCPPGNLNDAFRYVLADLKAFSLTIPDTTNLMPKSGGVFSGTQPIYATQGAFLHHYGSSYSSGRIFAQASGGSVPSGMVSGDILLEW